jgi:hypothetical protein
MNELKSYRKKAKEALNHFGEDNPEAIKKAWADYINCLVRSLWERKKPWWKL